MVELVFPKLGTGVFPKMVGKLSGSRRSKIELKTAVLKTAAASQTKPIYRDYYGFDVVGNFLDLHCCCRGGAGTAT